MSAVSDYVFVLILCCVIAVIASPDLIVSHPANTHRASRFCHVLRVRATSAPFLSPTAMVCGSVSRAACARRIGDGSRHLPERRCAGLVREASIPPPNLIDAGWSRGGLSGWLDRKRTRLNS